MHGLNLPTDPTDPTHARTDGRTDGRRRTVTDVMSVRARTAMPCTPGTHRHLPHGCACALAASHLPMLRHLAGHMSRQTPRWAHVTGDLHREFGQSKQTASWASQSKQMHCILSAACMFSAPPQRWEGRPNTLERFTHPTPTRTRTQPDPGDSASDYGAFESPVIRLHGTREEVAGVLVRLFHAARMQPEPSQTRRRPLSS